MLNRPELQYINSFTAFLSVMLIRFFSLLSILPWASFSFQFGAIGFLVVALIEPKNTYKVAVSNEFEVEK